jgi:uncharacterized membrane protein required for colicin V production
MDRHWTLNLVALAGMVAGFVLFAVGDAAVLAGVVTAGSAYAALVPEFADDGPARQGRSGSASVESTERVDPAR